MMTISVKSFPESVAAASEQECSTALLGGGQRPQEETIPQKGTCTAFKP